MCLPGADLEIEIVTAIGQHRLQRWVGRYALCLGSEGAHSQQYGQEASRAEAIIHEEFSLVLAAKRPQPIILTVSYNM